MLLDEIDPVAQDGFDLVLHGDKMFKIPHCLWRESDEDVDVAIRPEIGAKHGAEER